MLFLRICWRIKAYISLVFYKILFGRRFQFGKNFTVRWGFGIYLLNGSIKIGDNCFFNRGCSLNILEGLEIGDNCIFGENVKIYDQNHRFSRGDMPIREQGYNTAMIHIGNDCWIGSNTVILKGVTIGSGCVIGAGCVIDRDIPENSVVRANSELAIEHRGTVKCVESR